MASKVKKTRRMIIMYSSFAVVLVTLVLYIALRRPDRIQYGLPEIPAVSAEEIDAITVKSANNGEINLRREDSSWIILPEGYKADAGAVDDMLEAFAGFTITDLISTSSHYEKYDLDDTNKLSITASGSGEVLLSVDLGKRAPSYNHTYVAVGDGQVYNAATDLRRIFGKERDSLRSRLVLSFARDEIIQITASLPDAEFILAKSSPAFGTADASAALSGTWKTPGGDIWEDEIIDEFLDRLDDLTCSSFIDSSVADEIEPMLSLKLQGREEYGLELLADEESGYRARSSQTPYEFYISSWQGDNILETFERVKTAE